MNLVALIDCDDFPFDRFTGEQPCDEVEPSADAGDDVVDLFEGDGDLDIGEGTGLNCFKRFLALVVVESLSAQPSEHIDSESFSLILFFSVLI